jgi:hypothetical protein
MFTYLILGVLHQLFTFYSCVSLTSCDLHLLFLCSLVIVFYHVFSHFHCHSLVVYVFSVVDTKITL